MIDRTKLLDMMDGDEAMVEKFIDVFKMQVDKQIPLLKAYMQVGNLALLSNSAHIMKTQTAYLGLDELTSLSQTIEQYADEGKEISTIAPLVAALEVKLSRIIQEELT
jgi:HPt (histidine-containing phosphotransfer) domain-containing protein